MDPKAKKKLVVAVLVADVVVVLLIGGIWWIARGDRTFQVVEEVHPTVSSTATGEALDVPEGSFLRIALADTTIEIAHDGRIGARILPAATWTSLQSELGSARRSATERKLAAASDPEAIPPDAAPSIEVALVGEDASERIVVSLRPGDPEVARLAPIIEEIRRSR